MNKQEALKLLEFKPNDNPSKEDLNKVFRKLTAKYHPDICKDEGAEERFKKMSEAYEYLKNPPPEMPNNPWPNPRPRPRRRNPFPSSVFIKPRELLVNLPLSFKESVLGFEEKTINYKRQVECRSCEGACFDVTDEDCVTCDGNGVISQERGMGDSGVHTTVHWHCQQCMATGKKIRPCDKCKGSGITTEKAQLKTKLPGGGTTGKTVRIPGKGNISIHNGHQIYGDLIFIIKAKDDPNMSIVGQDVISTIDIDLLDALKGTTCKGNTVLGEVDLTVPPKSKNQDKVKIPKHGVNKMGNHIFKLNIEYPKDVEPLIKALESKEEKTKDSTKIEEQKET